MTTTRSVVGGFSCRWLPSLFLLVLSSPLFFTTTTRGVVVVEGKAIMGIDMGSLYMKVALVQRNAPLEIVTNMHSKRKTEVMVLFDNGSRFYGADASSLLARKPQLTPTCLGAYLGRDEEHPVVRVLSSRHTPLVPAYNATRHGVCLTVAGASYTPEELVAMVLNHARDISVAYAHGGREVRDCVLTVPSYATQHERLALLDAAALANLHVLALVDENAASALNFGMDRVDEEPRTVLFYNLGAGGLQVSVVTYHSYLTKGKKRVGSFEVRGKGWDSTLGGAAFDHLLTEHMADEFNELWQKQRGDGEPRDVRDYPRPMTKLRLQANKAKQVLSANKEIPVYIDSLYDDTTYSTTITRHKLEELADDLFQRATRPIDQALRAANLTLDDVHVIELLGGGMRVPRVQEVLKEYIQNHDNVELGMHINSDESMALGAAFHGANVSTAFKVRQIGMTDRNPFSLSVTLTDMDPTEPDDPDNNNNKGGGGGLGGLFGIGKKPKPDEPVADTDASSEAAEPEEPWKKEATIFKANSKVGIKKTIAFTHDTDIHCSLDYVPTDVLPEGTELTLGHYEITGVRTFALDMEKKGLGKPKVSLQFELDTSGITRIIRAEAVVEEMVTVQEEVWEEVEVEEEDEEKKKDDASNATATTEGEAESEPEEEAAPESKESVEAEKDDATTTTKEDEETAETKEGDAAAEDKEEEPEEKKPKTKKVKKTVEKEKKKLHKRSLKISLHYDDNKVQPYSDLTMEESKAKLQHLDYLDQQRLLLEEAKNKVESYIYYIKNKLIDDEEIISQVTTAEQRDSLSTMAMQAEDWMYEDGYDADLATYEAKHVELSAPAEAVFFRATELSARPEAVAALRRKLDKVEELMTKWETEKPQVTEQERADVLSRVEEARTWMNDMEEKQAATAAHDTPAFTSAEVPLQTKKLESLVGKLSKRPKPKPPVVEEEDKNSTKEENATTEEEGEESTEEGEGGAGEETPEEEKEEETKAEGEAEEEEVKQGDEL